MQVKVIENHQNGKDTHVRGLKLYARDERLRGGFQDIDVNEALRHDKKRSYKGKEKQMAFRDQRALEGVGSLAEPEWLEAELR